MTEVLVDTLATARRVLATPDGVYSLTPHEALALAACTVRESTGRQPELPRVLEAGPVLPASLAAATAAFIQAFEAWVGGHPANWLFCEGDDVDRAFNTLKTRFEKEFPHV